ncbi:hypothetical protein ACFL21_02250 [Patescibacteria group bacterium]
MEVSYNLRYQKFNFSNKPLLDKEGEVIIYSKGFRLKGKGAADKGELINFSEIKEFYFRNEKIFFITFTKEKYILSNAGTLFDQLLVDMYKSRNEFLMDALFMKKGKLKSEFDAHFERLSKFGRPINKARAKLKLFEGSLVIIPSTQDAFGLNFNFVNFHEFDDLDYKLKITMDDGVTVFISQMGNDFEVFEEKMNNILGGMYGEVVNDVLRNAFLGFDAETLLKLAYKMRGGKAVSLMDLQKIDKELADRMVEFIFEDKDFSEKSKILQDLVDEYNLCFGVAKDETMPDSFIRWVLYAIPEKNVVVFSVLPRWQEGGEEDTSKFSHDTYFYKIIMEKGNPADKVEDKVKEIDQALVHLNFVKDPCYLDKKDLRHSPFQYAIRKLPYLRILRKSYLGKASSTDKKEWQKQAKEVMKSAEIK